VGAESWRRRPAEEREAGVSQHEPKRTDAEGAAWFFRGCFWGVVGTTALCVLGYLVVRWVLS
jgi:hypothetical protein